MLADLLMLLGIALMTAGLWLAWPPAALLFGGFVVLVIGARMALTAPAKALAAIAADTERIKQRMREAARPTAPKAS